MLLLSLLLLHTRLASFTSFAASFFLLALKRRRVAARFVLVVVTFIFGNVSVDSDSDGDAAQHNPGICSHTHAQAGKHTRTHIHTCCLTACERSQSSRFQFQAPRARSLFLCRDVAVASFTFWVAAKVFGEFWVVAAACAAAAASAGAAQVMGRAYSPRSWRRIL